MWWIIPIIAGIGLILWGETEAGKELRKEEEEKEKKKEGAAEKEKERVERLEKKLKELEEKNERDNTNRHRGAPAADPGSGGGAAGDIPVEKIDAADKEN